MTPRLIAVVALLLVIAVIVRLCGTFDSALQLWIDEAMWAELLAQDRIGWIRPPGYMWLTGVMTHVFGNTEVTLRSLSLMTGVALPFVFWRVLRRLTTHPTALVAGLWLVAIHPALVEMSKEFKPYGLEAALHVALLASALAYLATSRRVFLVVMCAVSLIAPLFAWTVIFVYPAVFGVCGIRAIRERRRVDVVIGAASMVATLALLATLFAMRMSGKTSNSGFWGKKYGVFYMGDSWGGKLAWLAEKSYDIGAWPAQLDYAGFLDAARLPLSITLALLAVTGVAVLVREKRWEHLVLVVAPLLLTLLFNVIGKWPYGVFRTNVYLLVYVVLLVAIAVDALARASATPTNGTAARSARPLAVVGIALFVVTVPFDPRGFAHKGTSGVAFSTSVRTAMEHMVAAPAAPRAPDAQQELVLLDGHACYIWRYYAQLHDDTKGTLGVEVQRRFRTECSKVALDKWEKLLRAKGAEARWVLSAKATAAPITREVMVMRGCAEAALPAGTLLVGCTPR